MPSDMAASNTLPTPLAVAPGRRCLARSSRAHAWRTFPTRGCAALAGCLGRQVVSFSDDDKLGGMRD